MYTTAAIRKPCCMKFRQEVDHGISGRDGSDGGGAFALSLTCTFKLCSAHEAGEQTPEQLEPSKSTAWSRPGNNNYVEAAAHSES